MIGGPRKQKHCNFYFIDNTRQFRYRLADEQ
jgi:hypothetical protein